MVVGTLSWWIIVDFPSDATFLTPEEQQIVIHRLETDGQHGGRNESFKMVELKNSFTDWKTYTGAIMYMGVDGALYAFSLFLPSIIYEMKYTATRAQLMSVAPYGFACVLVHPSYSALLICFRLSSLVILQTAWSNGVHSISGCQVLA